MIAAIILIPNIKIVPQANEFVVELLGKYKCTWSAGIPLVYLAELNQIITLQM